MNTIPRNIIFGLLLLLSHSNEQEGGLDPAKVTGVEATAHEFPWLVNVQSSVGFCGGSILNEDWVVTAAHCVKNGTHTEITAGDHNIFKCDENQQKVSSCHIIIHENFYENMDNGGLHNDIALIKLSKSLEFSDTVKAIDLPPHLTSPGVVTLAGWGTLGSISVSPVVHKVDVNIVAEAACRERFAEISTHINITDNMICTVSPGMDSCKSDSGGPLMCKSGTSNYHLCGIVSFGVGCTDLEYSGVYTRVLSYLAWIESTMAANAEHECTSHGSQILISPSIYMYLASILYLVNILYT